MEGVCVAPLTYEGDCSNRINTTSMDYKQKRAFAEKCAVAFPCVREQNGQNAAGQDLPQLAWIHNGPIVLDSGHGEGPLAAKASLQTRTTMAFADRFRLP